MVKNSEHLWQQCETDLKEACIKQQYDKAETILAKALKIAEESGVLDSKLLHSLHTLAAIYCMDRQYAKAEGLYRHGLKAREKAFGANHPDIVDSLERLAVVVQETRGKQEAMAISFRAQTMAVGLRSQLAAGQ